MDRESYRPDLDTIAASAWPARDLLPFHSRAHAALIEPTARTLQIIIDRLTAEASATSPRRLLVLGDVSLDTSVSLRSNVHIEFRDGVIGSSLSPANDQADVATNCLFRAPVTLNTARMNTVLAADATAGDRTITVANAGAIAPGDWIVFDGRNIVDEGASDIYANNCVGADHQEFARVTARNGNVLTLASPLRQWWSSLGTGTKPSVKAVTSFVENVRIEGGEFDCSGKVVATGFFLEGARNIELTGLRCKGFSRAFINAAYGCQGLKVHDLYTRGGTNSNLWVESGHDIDVRDWDFDPTGDYTHPQGYVRASYRHDRRTVGVRINGCRFGRVACALEWYGGNDCAMGSNEFRDLDGNYRTGRADVSQSSDRFGVAFNGGAGSITYLTGFGLDWSLGEMRASEVKTPGTACAYYLHDCLHIRATRLELVNTRRINNVSNDGARYAGTIISDVQNTEIDTIYHTGLNAACLALENGGSQVRIRRAIFSSYVQAVNGGGGNFGAHLIQAADNSFQGWTEIDHLRIDDAGELFNITGAAVPWRTRVAVNYYGLGGRFGDLEIPGCRLARVTDTSSALTAGAIVDVDNTNATALELHVKTAAAGGRAGQYVYMRKQIASAGYGHMALVFPVRQPGVVLCSSAEVKPGDKLRHGSGGECVVDNAAAADIVVGVAQSYKAAGAAGTVRISQ